jgi:mevalonate kinase
MKKMDYKVTGSAPGKLMLLGEHAVLNDNPCIAAAINKRIYITATLRADDQVVIKSDSFGKYETNMGYIRSTEFMDYPQKFRFILSNLKTAFYFASKPKGLDLEIKSEFPPDFGLGSSAAVSVATSYVANYLFGTFISQEAVFKQSLIGVINAQKKLGSGFDVAVCSHGGVVFYSIKKGIMARLTGMKDIVINTVYSGYKTPTTEVIQMIQQKEKKDPKRYKGLYNSMGKLVKQGFEYLEKRQWKDFGVIMNRNQILLNELGVSDSTLDDIVLKLRKNPVMFGSKISGSGLGDCVIGLSKTNIDKLDKYKTLNLKIDDDGVRREE